MIDKILYRCWQFYKAILPRLDRKAWKNAADKADDKLKPLLEKLGKAEKAHTLRVLELISKDNNLTEDLRTELSDFALVHDIGKAITKPSLVFKVAKVIFRLSSDAHCIAGCRAVWHLTQDKKLALRILNHHVKPNTDQFLATFQKYDDQA
ncbi:MAG: hypothetical protein IKO19_13890 [Candidatus Riflebacteria bacterium]|nr:hypothetical protein [Candidatus Riflebacteria bacterium]